jgi:hypothetical protein
MNRVRPYLIGMAVLAVMAGMAGIFNTRPANAQNGNAGSAPVTVVGPLPMPVADIRTPYQIQISNEGTSGFFRFDSDKKLTIEYVSARCVYPADAPAAPPAGMLEVSTTANNVSAQQWFPVAFVLSLSLINNAKKVYAATHPSRLYADPGSVIFTNTNPDAIRGFPCAITLSGYTTPAKLSN